MNINKCKFHVQKIFFLKLLLFIEELKMNLRKVQAVVEWSTSTNLTQMQFFVNFCNFYRRFIKNFSKIVYLLIQSTQKEMIFEWNQACQIIFDHMKKWITEVSILRHFDQNKETILETDSFNYVNDDILSQYNDEETLHSMIYYSKNLSFAECNYKIYDKKLLAIIRVFKHWWSELKLTELFIKMFTDHQALTSLMKDKELSKRQIRWVQKLVDFNFKIMYHSDKQNIKVDALTCWVDSVSRSSEDECICYQWITILTSNQMKIADLEKNIKKSIYKQILEANEIDENCTLLREVVLKDEAQYEDIKLRDCQVQNEILYRDDLLWVFFDEHLQMKLIQEVHDQSSIDHFEILRTMKIIRRYYYWSSMQKTISQYIWNCYICQQSKTSWDKFNELLHSLFILEQQWKNIVMNFIIDLSFSKGKNIILTVICRLIKKRHYISCFTDDERITAEKTAELMLQWIYQIHDLLDFIVSNRDSQFIFILWKSLCKRLDINLQLFTVHHSQINDQSEWVNQNVERYLWFFCLYMQNDWVKLLFMIKFINNNALFSVIFSISFFSNKDFHSCMSFELDVIKYESSRERLQMTKVKNISEHMNKTLKFARESLVKTWEQMMKQVNKYRKKVDYKIKSKMFLNERNIITARSFKKLDDKMLDFFINLDFIDSSYKLKLSEFMHVHDVFHSDLLRSVIDDILSDQRNKFSDSIVINDEDEWKIDNILNFRWYRRWLQYKVKWNDYDNDLNWYNADDDEFMNAQKIIDDFHI